MVRTAFFLAALCALLATGATEAHAGGWSFKKMRKSVQRRAKEAGDLGKQAVKKAGETIATGAKKSGDAVGQAARDATRKIGFGFKGTKKKVQKAVPKVTGSAPPCPEAEGC